MTPSELKRRRKKVDDVEALINRRRRQVLVHSVIYYEFNENLVSDAQWAAWGLELVKLQNEHPDIAKKCIYASAFESFDASSGYNLPLRDPWAQNKARYLLRICGKTI